MRCTSSNTCSFIRLAHTGALLERALGFLQPGEGAHLLMQLEALVIGLRHLADAAPVVRQLMTLEEMRAFDIDFDRELRQLTLVILDGLKGSGGSSMACSA